MKLYKIEGNKLVFLDGRPPFEFDYYREEGTGTVFVKGMVDYTVTTRRIADFPPKAAEKQPALEQNPQEIAKKPAKPRKKAASQ